MAAMESEESDPNALTEHPTKAESIDAASDKARELEEMKSEESAIAEAIVGSPVETDDPTDDLEKATTRASGVSAHEPARKIKTAVDWDGPDDPGNPMNWPIWKRGYHTLAIGVWAFTTTIGSSLITPATFEIGSYFNVSVTAAILPLTVYVLGLGFGPITGAPISETYGRTVVYRVTPPLFMLFLIGAGFTKTFGGELVCRLLAGIAGAPVLAVGAGTTADMYPLHHRAIATVLFVMMPFLGPGVGPVIGGFVAYYKGWRWTQYVTIMFGVISWILILPMQETYKKIILQRRAKKLGIPGPPKPNLTKLQYAKLLITITLARPVRMLFTEPIVLFLTLYNSFAFSVLFALFAAYPYTFAKVYNFNTFQSGLAFLGIVIGVVLGGAGAIIIDRKIYYQKYYKRALSEGKTAVPPERRLYAAMIGAFTIPIGLFWFAWTARPSVHWISPILAGIPFAFGNLSLFISAGLYLIDVYGPMNGASALAANGLMRYGLGACFPLFTLQMYETLTIKWATSLLGFISILMMPIPFVLFKYGPKIRARSSYDTTKF